jgi:hypothetical protein
VVVVLVVLVVVAGVVKRIRIGKRRIGKLFEINGA